MLTMRTHTMLFRPTFHPVMPVKNFDLTQVSALVVEKHHPMRSMLRGILRELGLKKVDDVASTESGLLIIQAKRSSGPVTRLLSGWAKAQVWAIPVSGTGTSFFCKD